MALNLEVGSTYTFSTRAAQYLGAEIKRARLEINGMSYNKAMQIKNVSLMYSQIYPLIQDSAPANPQQVTFYLFTGESGEEIILAEPWIDESTIQQITFQGKIITIPHATTEQMEKLLASINYFGIECSIEDIG